MNELQLVWIDPRELKVNAMNWRRHPKTQKDSLNAILGQVGWAGVALLNERNVEDGWDKSEAVPTLIDGHLRREVGIERGEKKIPVLVGRWTKEQERKILATLDPIAAMAIPDTAVLSSVVEGLDISGVKLDFLLRDFNEVVAQRAQEQIVREREGEIEMPPLPVATPRAQIAPPDETFTGVSAQISVPGRSSFTLDANIAFPSSRNFNIPELLPNMLGECPEPISTWVGADSGQTMTDYFFYVHRGRGSVGLDWKRAVIGFYTDDSKWEHEVWDTTDDFTAKLLGRGMAGLVAPNFSIDPEWAQALRIYNYYRSRWVARFWQEAGIRVIPDLQMSVDDVDFAIETIPINAPCLSVQMHSFPVLEGRKGYGENFAQAWLKKAISVLKPQSVMIYANPKGFELADEVLPRSIHQIRLRTIMNIRGEVIKQRKQGETE